MTRSTHPRSAEHLATCHDCNLYDDDCRGPDGARLAPHVHGPCHVPCPDCGHRSHDAADGPDHCPDCDDAAQVGTYAPCAVLVQQARQVVRERFTVASTGAPATITARRIIAAVRDGWPGAECTTAQTGGGCATVYVGPFDPEAERFAYAIGPGEYNWGAAGRSVFAWDEISAGPDDDGASDCLPMTCPDDLRAYFAAEYRRALAVDYRGPTDLEAVAEDAAAAGEILPDDGAGIYSEPLACYVVTVGDDTIRTYCGECIDRATRRTLAPFDAAHRVGARTAAICHGCGRHGAPARWSEALRGAGLWRALVLAFEPQRARHGRPGLVRPSDRLRGIAARDSAEWCAILSAADLASQPAGR